MCVAASSSVPIAPISVHQSVGIPTRPSAPDSSYSFFMSAKNGSAVTPGWLSLIRHPSHGAVHS